MPSNADTVIYNALLDGHDKTHSLFIKNGTFIKIEEQGSRVIAAPNSTPTAVQYINAKEQLILPGLVETHIHLDKACISSRCSVQQGTLEEAIQQTTQAKVSFNYQDIYSRGQKVIEKAIKQGTSYMRTHVEIDPIIGLVGFQAIKQLKQDYTWAIHLEICVFPQEGIHNNPGTEELLKQALESGADLLGGCPYTDSHPVKHIETLFKLATQFNVDLDFHLDFDLNPETMSLPDILAMTEKFKYQHRVTVGHVTKLSAIPPEELRQIADKMANIGVRLTVLPSTDLFLSGRDKTFNIPRGVAPIHRISQSGVVCSISSNNIENPFTPYGDVSQVRQANLFANIAQLASHEELSQCMDWVSHDAAKIMKLPNYGIAVGNDADINFYPAKNSAEVIATIVPPSLGMKKGRVTFKHQSAQLLIP
ncbi:amidohydrolase family protein [Marinomonas sp.]|nr:amidohydrolase family protein [Marinomonas sp.]MDB4837692.1 amidohydrolase family protein [Marinomonas sp.]